MALALKGLVVPGFKAKKRFCFKAEAGKRNVVIQKQCRLKHVLKTFAFFENCCKLITKIFLFMNKNTARHALVRTFQIFNLIYHKQYYSFLFLRKVFKERPCFFSIY